MNQATVSEQPSRTDLRRQQVLDAAADCFRRYGFHGASIAKISKRAGMSPGHIYHFFPSKEAIIAALVARKTEARMAVAESIEREDDVLQAMIDRAEVGLEETTEPEEAALWVEIWAEATRNEDIARLIAEADDALKHRMQGLEARGHRERGVSSAVSPDATSEVIMALFSGLSVRTVLNPKMDRHELVKVLRVALKAILEA